MMYDPYSDVASRRFVPDQYGMMQDRLSGQQTWRELMVQPNSIAYMDNGSVDMTWPRPERSFRDPAIDQLVRMYVQRLAELRAPGPMGQSGYVPNYMR